MGAVNLTHTLIEPRAMRSRRAWFRFRNWMIPPIVQLVIGLLPPEWER